ncbi:MarR family winged helix-turn-helix transcriptional regulator [Bdellovibrio sp. HCB2-146]|uniref:MarR family winged helix-turn-helix transcriptional regulator n=1 Tax=Bdellovibrio sp. HCB2-146 TaxID=3394362 RepID=UPI0039BC3B39
MKTDTAMNKMKPTLLVDDQLCFAIYSASLAMNKLYRKQLGKLDLTYPQYLVMMVLWENDEQSVSQIGERLFLDSATLTPLLKRMETAGFITRKRLPADERVVIVTLTSAGKKLKQKAEAVWEAIACAAECTVNEAVTLKNQLNHLRDNLTKNT